MQAKNRYKPQNVIHTAKKHGNNTFFNIAGRIKSIYLSNDTQ